MEHIILDERMTMDELSKRYPWMWAVLYNMTCDDSGCPTEAMVYSVSTSGDPTVPDRKEVKRKYGDVTTMLWPTSFGTLDGGIGFIC